MAERKLETINLQGQDYSKVAIRVKAFRADFPNGKIITKNTITETGDKEFTTYIWRDRKDYISGDLDSADSTGTSQGPVKNAKAFEKLETISVGRALALLGYLASGDVASFEEMEQYYADKEAERVAYIAEQVELFENAKTLDELRELWSNTNKKEAEIMAAKDKRKAELEANTLKVPPTKPTKKGVDAISKSTATHETSNPIQPKEIS